jgi:hypothetical protein
MANLTVGQEIWVSCTVQPGPFTDEPLVTVNTLDGPISGFVESGELRIESNDSARIRAKVHRETDEFIEVWIRGLFFTTNGLAQVAPESALAA